MDVNWMFTNSARTDSCYTTLCYPNQLICKYWQLLYNVMLPFSTDLQVLTVVMQRYATLFNWSASTDSCYTTLCYPFQLTCKYGQLLYNVMLPYSTDLQVRTVVIQRYATPFNYSASTDPPLNNCLMQRYRALINQVMCYVLHNPVMTVE
jgi:hypothetical protein